MSTHFLPYGHFTACGLDKRSGGVLISSPHIMAVDCPGCKQTREALTAVQRLPPTSLQRKYSDV